MNKYQRYRQTPKGKAAEKRASRKYYVNNREKEIARCIAYTRRRTTGVTQERYDAMMEKQSGVCGICGGNRGTHALGPDHNHETGEVRDLLCGPCNSAIGLAGDSVELLRKMVAYLERHNGEPSRLCPE